MAVLHSVYFSAKGTTEICARCISENLGLQTKEYNWCSPYGNEELMIPGEDVLLFAMPIYGGYIPKMCEEMTARLKGDKTPAIIVAVYGNRHYDNSLLQMRDLLTARGFVVIAAGAFLAEHSIFPTVGAGRPDDRDRDAMEVFAKNCKKLLTGGEIDKYKEIELPGDTEYDSASYKGVPFQPDADDSCVGCGCCVGVCPVSAIDMEEPRKTNPKLCISCGACIKRCPVGARNHHAEAYPQAKAGFEEKCGEYRVPESYFIKR